MDDAADQARMHAERWAMLLPHRDLAVGMVLRAGGNLADAEDSVHDAMLRLVRRDDLDPVRVRSLLIRASLHIAIDRRRAAARQQDAVVRLGGEAAGQVSSPEQVAATRADAERVLSAVDALPRREREVILLRLAGLNVAETARRLGISAKSVEGAYTRARARLRLLLAGAVAWVAARLRRLVSPHVELAAATTVAALLLAGPSWDRAVADPGAGQASAAASHGGLGNVRQREGTPVPPIAGGPALRPGAAPWPGSPGSATAPQPDPFPFLPHGLVRPGPPAHTVPPNCTVCVPIDAPGGLASTGVFVSVGDCGKPEGPEWVQRCLLGP